MKKKIIIIAAVVVAYAVALLVYYRETRIVGEIHGSEFNRLVVGGNDYSLYHSPDLSSADKGSYLGKAIANNGSSTFRLYSVKNDHNSQYIYATWNWEGFFYRRSD